MAELSEELDVLRALGCGTVSALSLLHGQELAALVCSIPSLVLLMSSFCWGCLPGVCLKPPPALSSFPSHG